MVDSNTAYKQRRERFDLGQLPVLLVEALELLLDKLHDETFSKAICERDLWF